MVGFISGLSSVPLVYGPVLVPVPNCLDYCGFVVELEVRSLIPPPLFFFLRIALSSGSFVVAYECWNDLL